MHWARGRLESAILLQMLLASSMLLLQFWSEVQVLNAMVNRIHAVANTALKLLCSGCF